MAYHPSRSKLVSRLCNHKNRCARAGRVEDEMAQAQGRSFENSFQVRHMRSTCLWLLLALVTGAGACPAEVHFHKVVLAANLVEPIQLSIAKDGRVFFGERGGAVKVWEPGSGETRLVGKLSVKPGPEDGLLGLALDPGFLSNGWVYVFHS